ncbi:hypothetical protein T484DRAFT_1756142 [Baffinella frigidus]|nr:hypothetical protein T484DRAFT_1756142 [Cryptophyta sp. CCMP2293]
MSAGPEAGQGSRGDSSLGVIPTGSYMAGDGGGTYTKSDRNPSIQEYESVFGPSARDIKEDPMRSKRHQRWHLPDVLKGPNPFLTDRIDGLITDTTNSPFTSTILPYTYLEHPDAKIKWNVWSFDEGMANRVPYESAARVLTQSKQSFAGYTVRQGLAITMEHNFMMSPEGRVNFANQLKQMVGSIQYTNDLDVHIALITAPSYARKINEKYYARDKNVWQRCRQYVDLFGIMQKNPNALDLIIEDTKATMKSWGSQDPSFILTNSKLTMQLTMTPEKTQYVTQGPDGLKRLADGPNLTKYRGLDVIHSRSFSTETGARPRDLLDRRVRVAEYYVVHGVSFEGFKTLKVQMYDQSKDTMFVLTGGDLIKHAALPHESRAVEHQSRSRGGSGGPLPTDLIGMIDKGISGKVAQTTVKPPGGVFNCPTWSDVARIATIRHQSIFSLIEENAVNGVEGRYVVSNALTMPYSAGPNGSISSPWVLGLPTRMASGHVRECLKEWSDFSANSPEAKIYMGESPNDKIISYLLEDVNIDIPNISAIHTMLGYAMGFPPMSLETDGPQVCLYKKSRLFMLNAWFAAQGTRDESLFDGLKLIGSTTVGDWFKQIRSHADFVEMVNQDFNPLTGTESFGGQSQESVNYWSGNAADMTPADCKVLLLHLVRHMMALLFGTQDAHGNNTLSRITMRASGGIFMGYKFHESVYLGAEAGVAPPGSIMPQPWVPGENGFDGDVMPDVGENIFFQMMKNPTKEFDIVMIRPNIEHNMLGVVMGRGGKDDLGATFWGQTELSVYDDGMHGKWGMSYKYHERAIVLNEKNLMRCWDVAFNGYNGGCDDTFMTWGDRESNFRDSCNNLDKPYDGPSICCMIFPAGQKTWPNPIMLTSSGSSDDADTDQDA